jgi:DoxX-like protein
MKQRKAAYWASTGFAALALGGTGLADLLRVPVIMEGLAHHGYPTYFATILGTWELLGAAAIVAPELPRVKEWAYAGMFFALSGAALSHAASGDPMGKVLVPLVVLGAVAVSWTLRPRAAVLRSS